MNVGERVGWRCIGNGRESINEGHIMIRNRDEKQERIYWDMQGRSMIKWFSKTVRGRDMEGMFGRC